MRKVAILIPCLNEELTIASVIEDFASYFPSSPIYVYDNISIDRTADVARECAKRYNVIVRKTINRGKGNVVKQMLEEIDSDIYILVDGDGTYLANDAMKLMDYIMHGYDMAIGDRLSKHANRANERMFHRFGNKLVNRLLKKMYGGNIMDSMSGLRAFNNKFAKGFKPRSHGFEIETEMNIYALKNGFRVYSYPIHYKRRAVGSASKLSTVRDGIRILWFMWVSRFRSYNPE